MSDRSSRYLISIPFRQVHPDRLSIIPFLHVAGWHYSMTHADIKRPSRVIHNTHSTEFKSTRYVIPPHKRKDNALAPFYIFRAVQTAYCTVHMHHMSNVFLGNSNKLKVIFYFIIAVAQTRSIQIVQDLKSPEP